MKRKLGRRSARNTKSSSNWKELLYFLLVVVGAWLFSLLGWGRALNMRGVELADYILGYCGWGIFIPLLFFIYVCVFGFFGFGIARFASKFMGTASLFFVSATAIGLYSPIYAGEIGRAIAKFLSSNIGFIPAATLVVVGFFASAALYGVPLASALLVTPTRWLAEKFSQSQKARDIELERHRKKYETIERKQSKLKSLTDAVTLELDEEASAAPQKEENLPPTQELLKISLATLNKKTEAPPEPEPIIEEAREIAIIPTVPTTPVMREIIRPPTIPASAPEPGPLDGTQEIAPDPELPEEEDDISIAGLFPPPIEIFGAALENADSSEIHTLAAAQGEKIVETLQNFGVKAEVAEIVIGPSVVQFQIHLAPGIRVNKIAGLANDLAMALAVISVRVEAPIPGKPYVGIEIPNIRRRGIPLRSVVESSDYRENKSVLPLPMGMRVDSRFMVVGLEDMPHMLVAGTTGSGKSVFTNTCIIGMCNRRTPDELKLILVDPKHVEFAIYDGLPHLLSRPISDPKKAVAALGWAVQQMESRSAMFALAKVRNLDSYNEKLLPKNRLPYIVIVVDELADLMYSSGKEVESLIARLAQKARSAGIHLILATQRPSVDVITGLIKANVPARVAFALPSQTDSRTIIDTGGADKLLGKGDMLFLSTRYPRPLRIQASFINEERTLAFIENLKQSFGAPEYIDFEDYKGENGNGGSGAKNNGNGGSVTLDPKIDEALNFIMDTGIASASKLQTLMGIGYPRASRMIATLEQLGILGPQPSSPTKPRDILMDGDEAFERIEEARS